MKKLFFLSGAFRCGNTLLRSILNQNPNLHVSSNSLTPEIFHKLDLIKYHVYNEENSHKQLDNVIQNIFNNYYKDIKKEYIIDQARWGTKGNYYLLQKNNLLPKKFIFLIRPLKEIIASYIRLDKPKNIYSYCDELFSEYGRIGHSFLAFENLIKNHKDNLHIVKYNDLCSNPQKTIKLLYDFLDIPQFKHKFENLNQVNDSTKLTTIRTDKIKKQKYKDQLVPKEILKKYKNIDTLYSKYGI